MNNSLLTNENSLRTLRRLIIPIPLMTEIRITYLPIYLVTITTKHPMNENLKTQDITNPPLITSEKASPKVTRATVPLDTSFYKEIESLLLELSNQLGMKVTMPVFLRKTIVENWKVQMERYRKLNPSVKRARS